MTALALVLSLALLGPPDGGAAGAGGSPDASAPRAEGADGGAPDGGAGGGASDPDAEVIEHLELLERLQLLELLQLFDAEAPAPGKKAEPAR